MPEGLYSKEIPKFKNPEEELNFLRRKVSERIEPASEKTPERITKDVLDDYSKVKPEEVLESSAILENKDTDKIVLELSPESHDTKMEELLGILLSKGVRNTLSVIERMNNPHLSDDFHRFLIQYIQSVDEVPGLKDKTPLFKALHMKLYEVTLPHTSESDVKDFKELISIMEQFYSGMQSVSDDRENKGKDYFVIEIALSDNSSEVVFYTSVPISKSDLFEKQVLASYPEAKVIESKNDYNIFNFDGKSVGSYGKQSNFEVFPIKTYDNFDYDPMNAVLNVFSKLKHAGEGAAIQLVVRPSGEKYIKRYNHVLDDVKSGMSVQKSLGSFSFISGFQNALSGLVDSPKSEEEEKEIDDRAVEFINQKLESTIVSTNIRIIASAESNDRAERILKDLQSAFNQFTKTNSNSIIFESLKSSKLSSFFRDFSFRVFSDNQAMHLNLREVASMFHFPASVQISPQLKSTKSGVAAAPLEMGAEGVLLGVNNYRGKETKIFFSREDRMRHFYTVGQTGTGKTTLLKNMIIQDIRAGDGVCFIDPHGSDIHDILSMIPENRVEDVIYFDPAHTDRPMGLNMLEYDTRYPEQKTFVVNELFSIFQKLYGAVPESMGPMFEQYFRNATMLVIEDPETGDTLLDVSRVLSDEGFRQLKLSKCKNPIVKQFWTEIASKAGGEAALANIVPYITSKFDVFLANDIMRPIVAQQKSAFNFRSIMDEKKILLVNLSKGRLGDINANLIGLILVGKILMAALSRVDAVSSGANINDFYLYIDEFQNVTTSSISTILSEARKYRLSLNIAHQFIAQLEEGIKDSVFGNVGSISVFRVGAEDAKYLESQFEPTFSVSDIMKIDNYNAYVRMLIAGQPARPFDMRINPPERGNPDMIEKVKQLSYQKFGRDRSEVESEISKRYMN